MAETRLLAERRVPRYTSYPTAPQFTADIGPAQYAAWLGMLPGHATLSLYLHVPYCAQMCLYCGCHTKLARRREPVEAYADRLVEEIRLVGRATQARRVVHLHWGGGTPSMLGEERITAVMAALGESFDLSSLQEHAFELDPRHVTRPLARALATAGVDRASLGVQEFSPDVQQAIGRPQPFDQVAAAVDCLRAAGVERINFDLMYGLPRQSVADCARSAERAATLRPQRIALFGYAHVPWLKKHQRLIDETTLPDAAARLAQSEAARQVLIGAGYVPIGLDHFALPGDSLVEAALAGRLRRNFQGYTADAAGALIGFGASAIGRLPDGFVQNAVDIAGYARAVAGGSLATARGVAFSADDRLRARIIERLMCDLAVDLEAVANDDRVPRFDSELADLRTYAAEGLIELRDRHVVVTEAGRPFVRLVAAAFDAYLARANARHSAAV